MTTKRDPGTAGYARAIERSWSELLGRAVVFSPRDWALVARWYERGIPFELVRECMEHAAERGRSGRGSAPRSLAGLAPALEEAWGVVLAGRLELSVVEPRSRTLAGDLAREAWLERLEHEAKASALGRLLSSLLERLDGGAPPERIDEALDDALAEGVAGTRMDAARAEVEQEMESVRQRMPPERFEATLRRATLERMRRRLGLPRLTPTRSC